jgi:hypothetical protein
VVHCCVSGIGTGLAWRIGGLGAAALVPPALLWLPGVATSPEKLYGVAATSMALTLLVLVRIANLFRQRGVL